MSARVIPFPASVGAFRCPEDGEAFRAQHAIALFPGRLNRWAVTLRMREDAPSSEVGDFAIRLFQAWLPLFPGPIEIRNVAVSTFGPDGGPAPGTTGLTSPFPLRGPQRRVRVDFVYDSPATMMGLPTFVQRRRDRIDPLCPVFPLDAVPLAALPPGGEETRTDTLEPPEGARDPWNLGMPQLDLDELRRELKSGLRTLVFATVGLGLGVLVFQALANRRGAKRE